MIRIENVTQNISSSNEGSYGKSDAGPVLFTLTMSIRSDSREFLERVSQAVHRELANPEPTEALSQARGIGSTYSPGMGT